MAEVFKSWREMQEFGAGGATCKEALNWMDTNHPDYTDDTQVSQNAYLAAARSAGAFSLIFPSVLRPMNASQRIQLVSWLLTEIQDLIPGGWDNGSAVSGKIDDIIDCLANPTAGKKTALREYAATVEIDDANQNSYLFERTVLGFCYLTAADILDLIDIQFLIERYVRIANEIGEVDKPTSYLALLDEVETLLGMA